MSASNAAFKELASLATSSLEFASALPAQIDATPYWSGVGFSLLGLQFVIPMGEISEMLEVPGCTRLPGVYSWVKGVANVRGRLLPVLDMAEFFNSSLTSSRKQQRILVLDNEEIYAGLWVDQVFGMQHFPVDNQLTSMPDSVPEVIRPFITGGYQANKPWYVFSPMVLLQDQRFLDAAN